MEMSHPDPMNDPENERPDDSNAPGNWREEGDEFIAENHRIVKANRERWDAWNVSQEWPFRR